VRLVRDEVISRLRARFGRETVGSASCETICRPGPRFSGTHRRCRSDLPGLGKRPGFTGSDGQRVRAIPQPQKGTAVTIVEDARAITGRGHCVSVRQIVGSVHGSRDVTDLIRHAFDELGFCENVRI
jgi:hypothetical protein